ncbi:MFS transporter [Alkalicoccobacillus murimartini]|uniref:MFS family arabinose efflux permease n=1 Tax=Alkalicoccobacillus murimartini TaxID=171685 RepID=A0ABT9YLG6_9BACI|nr:MFS transporter [Alkalicoccobacillus murimartini]MDQ0208688.1 putative MFS family arabinose efflux permease [Alkalicoccobacillus murimartini]
MWKFVLPGIAMIGVTYAFARFSFGLFLPNISESLNLTESDAGLVSSSAYLAYTLALLTSAYLIQKFGQLRVIQYAGISAVIGLLGISLSPNFYLLLGSTFIAGLGSGWGSPAFAQVASQNIVSKDRDKGNTWINSGTSFGIIISGPVALLFTEHWRLSFLFFASVTLAVLLWNSYSIPNHIPTPKSNEKKSTLWDWFNSLKKAKYLLMASLIIGISSSIFWTFSRSLLSVVHSMSNFESVIFWIVMGVSGVIGGVTGGTINKLGLPLSYRLTLVLMMISISIITLSYDLAIYTSAILFGITYIFMTGILIVWATRIYIKLPSLGVSMSFLFLGIGQSIGSFVAGQSIDALSYPITFVIFSLIGLIGLFVPVLNKNQGGN